MAVPAPPSLSVGKLDGDPLLEPEGDELPPGGLELPPGGDEEGGLGMPPELGWVITDWVRQPDNMSAPVATSAADTSMGRFIITLPATAMPGTAPRLQRNRQP